MVVIPIVCKYNLTDYFIFNLHFPGAVRCNSFKCLTEGTIRHIAKLVRPANTSVQQGISAQTNKTRRYYLCINISTQPSCRG